MISFGHILLFAVPAVPLALAMLMPWTLRPARLLAWAAMPGLFAVVLAPYDERVTWPVLFIGSSLRLDMIGAAFLGFSAFLWICAGIYASAQLGDKPRIRSFCIFWCLTLAGATGVFIAADAVTFYVCFALLSLSAFGLIIHDGTFAAKRAGAIYIVMAVLGETCLVFAFIIGANAANSLAIDDIRTALAISPQRDLLILLLLGGFGMKAGLIPLHIWLPLAHSAAPIPASAVLSGTIVTAGIIGLMRLLPFENMAFAWTSTFIWLGLATAFYGIVLGLMQDRPKPVLAYSTVSQMGLLITVLGAGMASSSPTGAHAAVAFYALHHGLAKAALFLAVGVVAASGHGAARWTIAAAALLGASIAGLPFMGGALAKLAIKPVLGDGVITLLVTLSATGTMLLMLHMLVLLRAEKRQGSGAPPVFLAAPFAAIVIAALILPWGMLTRLTGQSLAMVAELSALWGALWPVLVAFMLVAALFAMRKKIVRAPVGDIAAWIEPVSYRLKAALTTLRTRLLDAHPRPLAWRTWANRAATGLQHGEVDMSRWPLSGSAFLIVLGLLAWSMLK